MAHAILQCRDSQDAQFEQKNILAILSQPLNPAGAMDDIYKEAAHRPGFFGPSARSADVTSAVDEKEFHLSGSINLAPRP